MDAAAPHSTAEYSSHHHSHRQRLHHSFRCPCCYEDDEGSPNTTNIVAAVNTCAPSMLCHLRNWNTAAHPSTQSRSNMLLSYNIRKLHIIALAVMIVAMVPTIPAFSIQQYSQTKKYTVQSSLWPVVPMSHFNTIPASSRRRSHLLLSAAANDNIDDNDDEDDDMEMPPAIDGFDDDDIVNSFSRSELQSMTVAQLKQQLRLRGKKVSGTKAQLVDRLLEKNSAVNGGSDAGIDLQPGYSRYQKPITTSKQTVNGDQANKKEGKDSDKVAEAKARGADIVDVTEFVEVEEMGKEFRSSNRRENANGQAPIDVDVVKGDVKDSSSSDESSDDESSSSSSPEVWGEDARIVDDYEGRSVVVDGLSRTVIEYKGCDDTVVQAYVVGSRDSLKNFLRGGQEADQQSKDEEKKTDKKPVYASMEEEVYAIQKKREQESKRGLIRPDEIEGAEDATDPGTAYSTIERDEGDWGVYTPTGAQLSSSEVQGVLLLSDVYGPFTDNTQALADKIAFECQPVVVLVPDLFHGKPWTAKPKAGADGVERNEIGQDYEEWRSSHPEHRVDVDIRAAAAVLRERYAVSSIAVWGTCYGGGRALEAAAGWYAGGPSSYYEESLGSNRPPPPHVDPIAAIAWYPTRYNARKLFGKQNEGFRTFESGEDRSVAVMAVFAENDSLPGATPEDAMLLKKCLDEDVRIKDCMVKIFPDQKHGFAHMNLGGANGNNNQDEGQQGEEGMMMMGRFVEEEFGHVENPDLGLGGDAEVACLLSTAWMETYTRVFLPTVGTPVRFDADDRWSSLEMEGGERQRQEVRAELEEAIAKYEDVDVNLARMSQSASPLLDEGPGVEMMEKVEEERERIRQRILEKYDIREDDDEETFDRKFQQARDDGALDELLIDAYMDDSGNAYW